ncbi:MAG: hemerythrin domain-containing protein [Pseudomonadota bacterium]
MTDDTALETRPGLPEELRFLLGAYPRRIWGDHPSFGPTTRLYLDRHAMFREALSVMRRLNAESLDAARPAPAFPRQFGRVATFFVGELELHHTIEDHHYFPALTRLEPRLRRGFEILDRDHHVIHDALDRFGAQTRSALEALAASDGDPKRALGALEGELSAMERILDRHLEDEEELVIPVMLDRGEDALGL